MTTDSSIPTPRTEAMEQELYETRPCNWEVEKRRIGMCRQLEQENHTLRQWIIERVGATRDDDGMYIDENGEYIKPLN